MFRIEPDPRVGDDTTDDLIEGDEVFCPRCNATFSPVIDVCPDDGTRLIRWHAGRDVLLGATLDRRFRITSVLGEGGMGRVYAGIQLAVDRPVAIKVIREPLSLDLGASKRFLREARLLTSLGHPNIVEVFDYGQTDTGALYLVTELLRGRTLADELAAVTVFPVRRACEVGIQLADALAAAHGRGIVHRDLKPANIMILDAPVPDLVKVLDFGLAKSLTGDDVTMTTLTQVGAIMGTPLYMAPEALDGGADPRTDLYALGCILHELLAGTAPFADPSINVVFARHCVDPPPPLPSTVPAPLAAIVAALLAKSPDQRPASALEVGARLRAYLAPAPTDLDDRPTAVRTRFVGRSAAERTTIRGRPRIAASGGTANLEPDPGPGWVAIAVTVLTLFVLAAVITWLLIQ